MSFPIDPTDYVSVAKEILQTHIQYLLTAREKDDPSDKIPEYSIYVVWFAKTLQNWKAVIGTSLGDDVLYELTHHGDKGETYINAYQKKYTTIAHLWEDACPHP